MRYVGLEEAKAKLSELIDAIESGREDEIIITRRGKPAARLIAVATEASPC